MFRKIIARGWWLILAALLGGGAFFALQIPRLHINASTDAFMEEDDPGLVGYYETREIWGSDEYVIVSLTADDWFTEAGVERLHKIEAELAAVPWTSHTMSVLDVPLLRQQPGQKSGLGLVKKLVTGELTKFLRDDDVDLEAARAELTEHEMAAENLITPDGRSISVLAYVSWAKVDGEMVPPIDDRRQSLVDGAHAVAAKWGPEVDGPVWVSGIPFINRTLYHYVRQDMVIFGAASLLLFTLAFSLFFRRLRFVVLPIVCCLLPAAGMVGAMALLGIPIAIVTSNMPVLIFVLMLPYNVYFIERYRERRRSHADEDGLDSTLHALRRIAMPCLFSCATTVAGFVALSKSRIIPIRDFGQLMTVGMIVGFVTVFLFIPAAMRPLRGLQAKAATPRNSHSGGRLVNFFQRVTLAQPLPVVIFSAAVLAVSVFGALRISAENKFTDYFWPHSEIYKGLRFIDQNMGGTTWIEVILSTKTEEGLFKTERGLAALDTVEAYFEDVPEAGNILSLTSLRDEMRKTLPEGGLLGISDSRMFDIVNKMAPDLINQVSNPRFITGRTTIRMKETADTLNRNRILDGLDRHLAENAAAFEGMDIQVTGIFPVYAELLNTLIEGQKDSLRWVPLAVYGMLLILFLSPKLALLVLIPQALPATVLLGVMGWAGIPLDLVTVMIASIAIGVGIDAAIQYTMRFQSELEACDGDQREALRRAHATTGRAIWIATSIIVAGFIILVLSKFFPSVWFGLFTALAMLISQLATLTLLPSLFLLFGCPRQRWPGVIAEVRDWFQERRASARLDS